MSGETMPNGWKLMPSEPTWETLIAGRDALMDTDDEIDLSTDQIRECYRAMFAISPASAAVEAEKPNFCESCAGPLATCDCATPRPTVVVYGNPAPMTDAARAEYWQGVAERALAKQHDYAASSRALEWLRGEPEWWDTPREFRDLADAVNSSPLPPMGTESGGRSE